jgi:hypothetical protein
VITASAAVLWCAFVIATTFRHVTPLPAAVVYVPAVLVLPVVLHTLWRAGSDALLAVALVSRGVVAGWSAAALVGWLFACGAVHGVGGTERLGAVAGVVMVLHAVFGLIAVGLVKVDENPHLR